MANVLRSHTLNTKWIVCCAILLFSCISISEQFTIDIGDPITAIKKETEKISQKTSEFGKTVVNTASKEVDKIKNGEIVKPIIKVKKETEKLVNKAVEFGSDGVQKIGHGVKQGVNGAVNTVSKVVHDNVSNLDQKVKGTVVDIEKGIVDVASFGLDQKNKIKNLARDISPVLGQIANSVDPEWVLHMNFSRYVNDMEKALAREDQEGFVNTVCSMFDWQRVKRGVTYSVNTVISCFSCKFVIALIRTMMDNGKTDEQIAAKAADICTILHIQKPRVCQGIMELVGIEAIYVIRHSPMLASQMCSFYLGEECLGGEDPRHNWNVNFPTPKKLFHPTQPPREDTPRLKVLQISDTHMDPHYQIGANAECGEPVCCRADDGQPITSNSAAGRWGDYRKCDAPKWLLENTFQHISETHPDIDYVIWTGDIPPHDTWKQTREDNLQNLQETVALVAKYFKNVTVLPSVGNHESCPVDSFPTSYAPASKNMSWLFDKLSEEWGRWLPAETSKTIKQGAFYSVLVRPGFRIISVNGNYCNRNNFWLLLNSTDPAGEFAWLIKELQAAEDKGEKVHIIGHIPPGEPDCVKVWSKNYYDIIDRYEGTVMAQFYGHTHFDEFEVFYDTMNFTRPLSVGYIAPSVTPWENVNPSYRIYYVDGDHPNTTRSIIDFETWKMDLDKANQNGTPVWEKSYTAREAYQMPSLLPKDWDDLINRMRENKTLFDSYHRNYYRDTPVRPSCDEDCRRNLLCKMKSGRSHDEHNLCRNL